jgi:undecaprenyl-diphosphatase
MTAAGRLKDAAAPPAAPARRFIAILAGWLSLVAQRPRRADRILPSRERLVTGLTVSAALLAATMLFLDAWAIAQVRHLPLWVVDLFNEITDYGKSGWFLWPCGLLILALAVAATFVPGRFTCLVMTTLVVRLEFVFAAIAVPGLLVAIGKRLIGRVRPSAAGPFAYAPFSWRPDYAGMPSGHSTSAFAAAVALGVLWPRARPLLWLYALTIAASRVIISAHYPSDVIAGALVGGFGALLLRNVFAARRLGFVRAADGRVRVLPGPSWRRIKAVAARALSH